MRGVIRGVYWAIGAAEFIVTGGDEGQVGGAAGEGGGEAVVVEDEVGQGFGGEFGLFEECDEVEVKEEFGFGDGLFENVEDYF